MTAKVDYRAMTTPQLLSEAWNTATEPAQRDRIVTAMLERSMKPGEEDSIWPSALMAAREEMAGLYPDPADPQFAARLFAKREFYDARAVVAQVQEGLDPCASRAAEQFFELTPVQRIVSRFMHPSTPYQGLLLYHGVGVGKTCSAVTIAEQFLEVSPKTKVILLVPQAIQDNFKRTIFDVSKIHWDKDEKRWRSPQCTGDSYLERLGLLETQDVRMVQYRVDEDRRGRYMITGYQAFANWVHRTLKNSIPADSTDPAARSSAESEVLRKLFSDHLIIIDEAHNLRDNKGISGTIESDVVLGETTNLADAAENAGGKALNPILKQIVLHAEGLRLVFMTATPMYNAPQEILLLLNYLIMNDTKSEKSQIRVTDLFTKTGEFLHEKAQDEKLKAKASRSLRTFERVLRRYVSYMRGENPYTFPLRLRPQEAEDVSTKWPAISATKNPVELTEEDKATLRAIPLILTTPIVGSPPEQLLRGATMRALPAEGEEGPSADTMLDLRMQMANISYPNKMYGTHGWDAHFHKHTAHTATRKIRVFKPEKSFSVDTMFVGEGLRTHAPKIYHIIERVKSARGLCFVYSRYIKSGALPIAIALERAGFQRRLADGKIAPLLVSDAATPAVAPLCAVCSARKGEGIHAEGGAEEHPFMPATYILLTSEDELSPNFAGLVRQATEWPEGNEWAPMGGHVKVIVGSQVASEGLDLKCIREMHILDAWYHLNRTDQIIGRAIRYCSHAPLRALETKMEVSPLAFQNCLIYLHVLYLSEFETADMYAYRLAIQKAQRIGRVQRILKTHAWDCNLELDAITFSGLPKREQRDAQGRILSDYSIDDQDYSTYCDYQVCQHTCAVAALRTEEEGLSIDTSTFGIADARKIILAKQDAVRRIFHNTVMIPESTIRELFSDLPWEIASEALLELLDHRTFRVTRPDGVDGYLLAKGGYIVFQPSPVTDTDIPITLRYAKAFQLQRKFMRPPLPVFTRAEEKDTRPKKALKMQIPKAEKPTTGPKAEPTGKPATDKIAVVTEKQSVAPLLEEKAAATKTPGKNISALISKWKDWVLFVTSKKPAPDSVPTTLKPIWRWLLRHYKSIPELTEVALRWWFDKLTTFEEKQQLYEYALTQTEPDEFHHLLEAILIHDLVRLPQLMAYRIYNPTTMSLAFYCKKEDHFESCSSVVASFIDKSLGTAEIKIPDDVGELFGFLASKKGNLVFKSLNIAKPITPSSVGAECGNVSNLGEHRPRIQILHEEGRTIPELADLMLPDEEKEYNGADSKKRMAETGPSHLYDITHQPLCLYMEFLTRLFDKKKVHSKRWFLSAVEAYQNNLRGKKMK